MHIDAARSNVGKEVHSHSLSLARAVVGLLLLVASAAA